MKADPGIQQKLLLVQEIDIRVRQLTHRLQSLPQNAPLAELAARDAAVRARRADAVGTVETVRIELARLESDVATVQARQKRDAERLQATSSVKDVAALETELEALAIRLTELEDLELTAMEKVEDAERALANLDEERAAIEQQVIALTAERSGTAAAIEAERSTLVADREAKAATIPADLAALYEARRVRGDGVGAALLQHQGCKGCTMVLTGSDLEVVRRAASDDVLFCPECDRILIRTVESGL
ncbi:MAG: hypothetical protein B5766_06535 [Candidatus Lumbricidophila eiseniae]|uniref:Uncharacterized protein n=1 Tax=Candidatus Lumbricidiphila eiseniae TaxID=1969409 RepID=A0A2A6FRN4_9MICO|nr:MAG: hypothetical protein B5766_06535 [Candidatus Lumbricidophila eiseniae]